MLNYSTKTNNKYSLNYQLSILTPPPLSYQIPKHLTNFPLNAP